jgi:hypothetical protein
MVSALVAACSVAIAFFSLILSAYVAHLQRQHDRLSARPVFSISYYFNETGVGWRVANVGLGPARIRGFKVFVDGVSQAPVLVFADVIKSAFRLDSNAAIQFSNLYAGVIVPVGDKNILAWLAPSPSADRINAEYRRISFAVCYCSLYNECWQFTNTSATPLEGLRDDKCEQFANDPPSIWWEP